MHRRRHIVILAAPVLVVIFTVLDARGSLQQNGATSPASAVSSESSSAQKGQYSHANDLLIRGTVFNEHGLSFPNVKLSIRRATEKEKHWETFSNFRGEFAIRVPQGADYEVVAEMKGFTKQSHLINGKDGVAEEKVTFHMEPVAGGKK
jgi:hypothetical protein